MSSSQIVELARRLVKLERQVNQRKLPTLAYSTIDGGGALQATDEDDNLTMIVGKQYDQTNTAAVVLGPTPPEPTLPLVTAKPGTLQIYWDGTFADGSVAPMDFTRVIAYATPEATYTSPEPTNQAIMVGQFTSAAGGELTAALDIGTEYAVYLVTWTEPGKFSTASDVALGTPAHVGALDLTEDLVLVSRVSARNALGDETFAVDGADGTVSMVGDLLTDKVGHPRIELTDSIAGVGVGTAGAAQIRFIPGEDLVSHWDNTEPGFVSMWSNTSDGNDGFIMELVPPAPIGGIGRGRLQLATGNSGTAQAHMTYYGSFGAYFQVGSDQMTWMSGGNDDFLYATSTSMQYTLNNDLRLYSTDTQAVLQTDNQSGPAAGYRGKFQANSGGVVAAYGNDAGTLFHGLMAIGGTGSVRILSRTTFEVVNSDASAYIQVYCSGINTTSDRKSKTSLRAPSASALEALRAAPVYEYEYKPGTAETATQSRIGPMADDLPENIAPLRTDVDDDHFAKGLRSIDLVQMVGLLTQAVQELDAEMDKTRDAKPNRKARNFTEAPMPTRKRKKDPRHGLIDGSADRPARPEPDGSAG